ncbi:MAG: DEAD/DEAH box helicase [Candidatus Heimdallarchaeaceae archaeon]
MLQLRSYQQQAIDSTLYAIEMEGKKNIILEAYTSWGKSLYLSELANQLDGKVVILLNITALVDQIAEHLDEINVDYSILKAGYESRFDPSKKIQVLMSQTYYARHEKVNLGDVSYVLQDEGHKEWLTDRTKLVLSTLNPLARVSVTATPYDGSGYALEGCDEIIQTISAKQLEEEKFIVPVKVFIPNWAEQIDYSEIRRSGSDYSSEAISELINTDEYANLVLQSMNQLNAKQKKTIVFCSTIDHAERISNTLSADGYKSYAYHSKNNKLEAEMMMKSFKSSNIEYAEPTDSLLNDEPQSFECKCIVSVSKISTGFSVTDIELGVMCRVSLRRSLVVQMTGRLCRSHKPLDTLVDKYPKKT